MKIKLLTDRVKGVIISTYRLREIREIGCGPAAVTGNESHKGHCHIIWREGMMSR